MKRIWDKLIAKIKEVWAKYLIIAAILLAFFALGSGIPFMFC